MLFTGYSRQFILAIACNMQNNQSLIDDDTMSRVAVSRTERSMATRLWTHIELACGNECMPGADVYIAADPCMIYWDERGGF